MEKPTFELTTEGKETILIIRCKLPKKPEPSASGKSDLHASTNGNFNTGLMVGGKDLIAGLNVYTKK